MVSEKSLQLQPGDESFERESIYCENRKTQNNFDKCEAGTKESSVNERLQIRYGDLVYIEY